MPRSCRPSSSHLLAMEVTSAGQSFLWLVDPGAQLVDELRLLEEEMRAVADLDVARTRKRRTRMDEIGGIEHARAVLALVAARALIAAMRACADDIAVRQEALVGVGIDLLGHAALRDGRSSTARARKPASARDWAGWTSGRNNPTTDRNARRCPSGSHAVRRNRCARPGRLPAPQVPRACRARPSHRCRACRAPSIRLKRAKTSAGSIEPTRLPRCLTPLM